MNHCTIWSITLNPTLSHCLNFWKKLELLERNKESLRAKVLMDVLVNNQKWVFSLVRMVECLLRIFCGCEKKCHSPLVVQTLLLWSVNNGGRRKKKSFISSPYQIPHCQTLQESLFIFFCSFCVFEPQSEACQKLNGQKCFFHPRLYVGLSCSLSFDPCQEMKDNWSCEEM